MNAFIARWGATTFAVFLAELIIPGITAESLSSLMWAGLMLGVLNAVVRPVLLVLSLPLIVLSFGLVIPLINAMLLSFVGSGWIMGFHVLGFGSAIGGAIVISIVSWGMNHLLRDKVGNNIDETAMMMGTPRRAEPQRPQTTGHPIKKVEGRVIE